MSQITREQYDALKRVNFSTLKAMARSPAHYRHWLEKPEPDTDSRRLGRCVHLAVLEPEKFKQEVVVWSGGRRAGKEWEKFCAENSAQTIVSEEEFRQCLRMQDAVHSNPISSRHIAKGQSESAVLWNFGDVPCKARLDFDGEAIVDLKSTRNASPDSFGRDSYTYKYHVQAAFYSDGYLLASGEDKPFVILAVEADPPHLVQVYRVPKPLIEAGRRTYTGWLDRLYECKQANRWPGYAEGELDLELPRWAEAL